jgi:hypothetical protein
MVADRFRMIGLVETKPKAPNRDAEGKAIPGNQAVNRRVSMHIFRVSLEEQKQRVAAKKAGATPKTGTAPIESGQSSAGQGRGAATVPPANGALPKEQPKAAGAN